MFGRKALQVKLVKTEKPSTDDYNPQDPWDGIPGIITGTIHRLGKQVVVGVLGYVILDTARQCLVAHITK